MDGYLNVPGRTMVDFATHVYKFIPYFCIARYTQGFRN